MKRKVIQLAGKTSVVSLPSKWVKKYNVKKGEELDLIENDKGELLIRTSSLESRKSITLDIKDFNKRSIFYAMSALHKSGYDEIILFYYNKEQIEAINELLRVLLLGFVMVEQTTKKIVLRSVTNDISLEFDSTLRRAFLVTLSLADSSLDYIKDKNFKSLGSLINLENTNNQLTSFCLRLINKGLYSNENTQFISIVIWSLEKIADEYKYICNNLLNNDTEINLNLLSIYQETNEFLKNYYELFYKFSIEKLNLLSDKKSQILNLMSELELKNANEINLLNHLNTIIAKTSDLSSSIFAIHHKLN